MGLWSSLSGRIRLEITSASIPDILSKLNTNGISLDYIQVESTLTFSCAIRRNDLKLLKKLCDNCGADVKVIRHSGIIWSLLQLKKRPIAIVGILALFMLALYLPTRIFFVEVNGNFLVPDHRIIDAAQRCGISFGASRREVRSEKMKNALLDALPELQWAGVNTYGCVAVISVQERETVQYEDEKSLVSSIVASRDGIVSKITVEKGMPLCKTGQAVKAGQVLVSGYTDCGLSIRAERSVAEIFAQTRRTLTVISPQLVQKELYTSVADQRFIIKIGKKLINLSQDSGIPDGSCDKIYSMYNFTLPGGFQLPVSLICIQSEKYTLGATELTGVESENKIISDAVNYLQSHMIAGTILDSDVSIQQAPECAVLNGVFICSEMIGREQNEEFYRGNEQNR